MPGEPRSLFENAVQSGIAPGGLALETVEAQVFVWESSPEAFISGNVTPEGTRTAMSKDLRADHQAAPSAQSLAEQLRLLQSTLDEKWDLLARNQHLHLEILRLKEEITRQEVEIQSLRRDLSQQQSSHEREMEEYQRRLQERYNQQQTETSRRLATEKARFEERLVWTENRCSEALERAREDHAQALARAMEREGFWARLVRMMTWS